MKNGAPASMDVIVSHAGIALTAIPVVACLMQYLHGNIRKPGLWFQTHIVETKQSFKDMGKMGAEILTNKITVSEKEQSLLPN